MLRVLSGTQRGFFGRLRLDEAFVAALQHAIRDGAGHARDDAEMAETR